MDKQLFLSTLKSGSSYEINASDLDALDIIKLDQNQYHLIFHNKSYLIELLEACYESKSFTMKIDGKKMTVFLEDAFDLKIKELGLSAQESKGIKELKAPMPGLVLEILVEKDHEVKKGDPLLILEAMKMENVIKSPVDASIQSVEVDLKDAVNKNQILILFN